VEDIFDLPLREHEGNLVDSKGIRVVEMDSAKYAEAIAEAVNAQKELALLRELHYSARGMLRNEADGSRSVGYERKFRDSVHTVTDFNERIDDVEYDTGKVSAAVEGVVGVFDEDFISVPKAYPDPVVGDELTITLPQFKVVGVITEVVPL